VREHAIRAGLPSSPRRDQRVACAASARRSLRATQMPNRALRAMTAAMEHRVRMKKAFLPATRARRTRTGDAPAEHHRSGRRPATHLEQTRTSRHFNGELYNYRDLRERLLLCGHRFATQSDTEILVHAWEDGRRLPDGTAGMFAFACLISRALCHGADSLPGARPARHQALYYTQTPEGFAFASEVRALLASGAVPKTPVADAVTAFLLFGSVSEPVTIWRSVFPPSGASHAAARAGAAAHAARAALVGPRGFRRRHASRTSRAIFLRRKQLRRFLKAPCARISSPTCPWACFFRADWIPAQSRRRPLRHGAGI